MSWKLLKLTVQETETLKTSPSFEHEEDRMRMSLECILYPLGFNPNITSPEIQFKYTLHISTLWVQ